MSRPLLLLLAIVLTLLPACSTTDPMIAVQLEARRAAIASEPRGDWFIGRRYHIPRTQFWGYLRRPGQSWDQSRLIIFNEHQAIQPDRLPEENSAGNSHGYDHNHEYRIFGHFTGDTVYDPNSDIFVPEFKLASYQLITPTPGWLFKPNERFDGRRLLRNEPNLR